MPLTNSGPSSPERPTNSPSFDTLAALDADLEKLQVHDENVVAPTDVAKLTPFQALSGLSDRLWGAALKAKLAQCQGSLAASAARPKDVVRLCRATVALERDVLKLFESSTAQTNEKELRDIRQATIALFRSVSGVLRAVKANTTGVTCVRRATTALARQADTLTKQVADLRESLEEKEFMVLKRECDKRRGARMTTREGSLDV